MATCSMRLRNSKSIRKSTLQPRGSVEKFQSLFK